MAELTTVAINDLPDSDFAYIEPGGSLDSTNRTVPRSLRHFPIHDAAHVRNALARLSSSPFGADARPKVEAAARKFDIGIPSGKSFFDMKAQNLTAKKIDRWLNGEISRRILVVPYTGPIPGGKAGLDLDNEYFDEETDIYGNYPALRATNWRMMDWHHDDADVPPKGRGGPPISMKGVLIGEIELDDDADEFGRWAEWWVKRGKENEQRIGAARVAALQAMGQPIFGSSMAVYKKKASDGHIEVWPIYRHTASTSPRNTDAVIPPLKAFLTAPYLDEIPDAALKALLTGLDADQAELLASFSETAVTASDLESGEAAVKTGRVLAQSKEERLRNAIASLLAELDAIVAKESLVSEERTHDGVLG